MKLELENGRTWQDPDPHTIAAAIRTLDGADNSFAILSRAELTYLQTSGSPASGFTIEYQEGSVDKHFGATEETIDLEKIIRAFRFYASGHEEWRSLFTWKDSELATGCAGVLLLFILAAGLTTWLAANLLS